jgi:hypothetical protein
MLKRIVLFLPKLKNVSLKVLQLILKINLWQLMLDAWVTVLHVAWTYYTKLAPSFKICYSQWFVSFYCLYLHSMQCDRHLFCTHLLDGMQHCSVHIRASSFFGSVGLLAVALHENMEARPCVQRQTFVSLILNLRPAVPYCATYIRTSRLKATSRRNRFKDFVKWQLPMVSGVWNSV